MRQKLLTGSESEEQEFLFNWTQYNINRLPGIELLFHVPNGGKRDARTATALKRQGVKAGVPDLVLPVPKGGYHGAYIELKVGDNKPTTLQRIWLSNLELQGYFTKVCYGWKDAAETIERYLTEQIESI